MTERITAYLCPDGCGGSISITAYASDIDAISEGANRVTAFMQPSPMAAGCGIEAGNIMAYLIGTDESKYCDLELEGELKWARDYTFGELNDYINISAESPVHCHWIRTEIWLNIADIGPRAGIELWGYSEVSSGDEAIPDDKADVFSGGDVIGWTTSDNLIVPGDLLSLFYRLDDGENQEVIQMDETWWCCCCFTGGKITEINGESYSVECQQITRNCIRSDWTEYNVGDWVFVAALQGLCFSCGRTTACKQLCREGTEVEQERSWVILPLTIGGYGP